MFTQHNIKNFITFNKKSFVINIVLFVCLVWIAVYVKDSFIRPFLGDVLVVIWLYYFLESFINIQTKYLAPSVLVFAYGLEFAQYLDVVNFFEIENKIVKIVLGSTFDILDILAYSVGYGIVLIVKKFRGDIKT